MADLEESDKWELGIYQLEETDPVQGGPNGVDNKPLKQLANRTLYLKGEIEKVVSFLPAGMAFPWFSDDIPEGFSIMKGQAFDMDTNPKLARIWPDGILPDTRGAGFIGKEDGETVGVFERGQVIEHGHPGSSASSADLGYKSTNTTGSH